MSEEALKLCFAGIGALGALAGIGISSLFIGNDPSSTASYGLIGGILGAMTAYGLCFVGGVVWFVMEVLR
ncbi:Transmembrane domain-containing protein [Brazilian cedratvirus IHUMI]|uniref:Transmembrane domain-containing protein n=1 Tax=Brazilian cedratvirus IHUMI TaxID=2126980 RepID=A0A2R8FDC3_9VIRU|nr:Transmembrane domain-containing protein [Brazilian cedratvirus IHUMI]